MCECNSTYCDSVGSITLPPLGQYSSYLTSMAGSRLEAAQSQVQVNSTGAGERCGPVTEVSVTLEWVQSLSLVNVSLSGLKLTLARNQKYQRSGDSVEPWRTQQPSTSCLFLLVLRTSCSDSTSPLKVHQAAVQCIREAWYNMTIYSRNIHKKEHVYCARLSIFDVVSSHSNGCPTLTQWKINFTHTVRGVYMCRLFCFPH